MLYIFDILGADYIKFSYTGQWNPWMRIRNRFWTNCHPLELCNKLGPDNLNLVHLFEGIAPTASSADTACLRSILMCVASGP